MQAFERRFFFGEVNNYVTSFGGWIWVGILILYVAIGVSALKVVEWPCLWFTLSVEDVVNKLGLDELSFTRISVSLFWSSIRASGHGSCSGYLNPPGHYRHENGLVNVWQFTGSLLFTLPAGVIDGMVYHLEAMPEASRSLKVDVVRLFLMARVHVVKV